LADYARGLMGFAVVFNVGDIYYQQQLLEREVIMDYTRRSPSYIWISLHLLLSLAILFFAAGIKLVYDEKSGARRREEEFLMCGCAATSLAIIYLLRFQYKGIWTNGSGFRFASYLFRFGMAGACAVIPVVTDSALVTVGLLLAITMLLIVQVCDY
jgi:low temperature requirement protein LtrA